MSSYTPISFWLDAFNCPHCDAYAKQNWLTEGNAYGPTNIQGLREMISLPGLFFSQCDRCSQLTIWTNENKMVYPTSGSAPLPNNDLPEEIKIDFLEARSILELSPRGAAALLRLVIQKFCIHLGGKGDSINDDIAELVKNGLGETYQQAFDIVRVVGNNAVHPGQIDLKDNREMAYGLFNLINIISDLLITQPRNISQLFQSTISANQKAAIKKRDS